MMMLEHCNESVLPRIAFSVALKEMVDYSLGYVIVMYWFYCHELSVPCSGNFVGCGSGVRQLLW